MSNGNLLRRLQAGDTIIEVLIAIAVASAVLGGAYAVVGQTIKGSQQAQEHGQALKVAESQIEQLRSRVSGLTIGSQSFCFDTSGNQVDNTAFPIGATAPVYTPGSFEPKCRISDGVATERYLTGITKIGDVYKVYVTWDGPSGTQELVNLAYKVYPNP